MAIARQTASSLSRTHSGSGSAQLDRAHRLRQQNHLPEAIAAYRRVIAGEPDCVPALAGLGLALQSAGRLPEAIEQFEAAVAVDPRSFAALYNLAFSLAEDARIEAAIAAYRRALTVERSPAALVNLGALLKGQGRTADAVQVLREAAALAPEMAVVQIGLAAALFDDGQLRDALSAARTGLAGDPANADAHVLHAEILLELDDLPAAEKACRAAVHVMPGHSGALAHLSILLQRMGRTEEAHRLIDYSALLRCSRLQDAALLNPALEQFALNHPSLTLEPAGKATLRGLQTGAILASSDSAIRGLRAIIEREVREYLATVPSKVALGVAWPAPRRWHLTGWAVVLRSGGHQRSHVHPSGFLSGVYYVRVPSVIGSEAAGEAGFLRLGDPWFGRPRVTTRAEFHTATVKPEEGTLVLFPSYFWHHTVPFASDQHRISIAFDIIPQT
jgi:tetratricopeptide (TPR) repeat protein